ncbi:uncharacterized protein PHACADRAFT_251069 [Phanerochaete carnosa HHB-10118-sp]|uniref:Uncharacterized protein n=1 Tax=Phanerochaete carnosa (strain HHB-10118-sp) TaxID=650164 RepID=K5WED4_PHACS|nr:uncharacterized protein PHACADRAFT_251069 [Phanerochaete carnosa HHB-10118-sp]EKM57419.1 hypothetical protein PHACADRAFT_251069 [Phanerochaete carnosa HHB-10118-sp]
MYASTFRNAILGLLCVTALLLSFVQAAPLAKHPIRGTGDSSAWSGSPMMNSVEESLRNSEARYATRCTSKVACC